MWRHQIFIFASQHFDDHISVEHDKKPSHTKFDMNWSNLHRFQWGWLRIQAAISRAPMNQFPPSLGCGGFSSCSTDTWYSKCWNKKKKKYLGPKPICAPSEHHFAHLACHILLCFCILCSVCAQVNSWYVIWDKHIFAKVLRIPRPQFHL